MPFDAHKNFAQGNLASSISSSATSIPLLAGQGAGFPTPPFNVTVYPVNTDPSPTNAEICRVTGISGDTLTVLRAQEGSSPFAFFAGDKVAATITTKTLQDIETAAATPGPAIGVSGRHYLHTGGSSTGGYTTPFNSAFHIGDAISMRVYLWPDSWTTAQANGQVIFSHTDAGKKQYQIYLTQDGHLGFQFSADGSTTNTINSTGATLAFPGILNGIGGPVWIRADYTANVGGKSQVIFYYSVDNEGTWIQIGTAFTSNTPGPIYTGTSTTGLSIGSNNSSASAYTGRIYIAQIWTGSTLLAQFDSRALTSPTDFTDSATSLAWTHGAGATILQDELNTQDFRVGTLFPDRIMPDIIASPSRYLKSKNGKVQWAGNTAVARLDDFVTGSPSDYTSSYLAALAAVTPASYGATYELGTGTVLVEPGIYPISAICQVPNHVDAWGYGKRNTIFQATAANTAMVWGNTIGLPGHRGALSGNFFLDGNGIATIPIFQVLTRTDTNFYSVEVSNCVNDGIYHASGQNNLFNMLESSFHGGSGLVFDAGWGGNAYMKCEINQNGSLGGTPGDRLANYNLKIWNNVSGPNYNEPSDNRFYSTIFERWGTAGAAGNVYIGAAFNTSFYGCGFPGTTATRRANIITLRTDLTAGSTRTSNVRFIEGVSQGTKNLAGTGTVFCDALGGVTAWFLGRLFIQAQDIVWLADDNAVLWVSPETQNIPTSFYTTLFQNQGGGTKNSLEVIRNPNGPAYLHAAPTDALISAYYNAVAQDGMEAINVTDAARKYLRAAGAWKSIVYT